MCNSTTDTKIIYIISMISALPNSFFSVLFLSTCYVEFYQLLFWRYQLQTQSACIHLQSGMVSLKQDKQIMFKTVKGCPYKKLFWPNDIIILLNYYYYLYNNYFTLNILRIMSSKAVFLQPKILFTLILLGGSFQSNLKNTS